MSSVKLPKMSSLSQEITHLTSSPSTSDDEEDDPEDFAHLELAEHLKELSIDALEDRFYGRSRYVPVLCEVCIISMIPSLVAGSCSSKRLQR
jgi:hypothetical protein